MAKSLPRRWGPDSSTNWSQLADDRRQRQAGPLPAETLEAAATSPCSINTAITGLVLFPEIEVESPEDRFNIDIVAVGHGRLFLGGVKTGKSYLTNKESARYKKRMRTIAALLAPVRLTVVHAWTEDPSQKAPLLQSAEFDSSFIRLHERPWYRD